MNMSKKAKHRATKRQVEIMGFILAGEGKSWLDLDQLMEMLGAGEGSGVGTKQSVQASIRILEGHKLINRLYETRRGKMRVLMVPTGKAYLQFRRAGATP